MNYYEVHAQGLKAEMDLLGNKCPIVTWNQKEIRILPGSAIKGKKLGEGGFRLSNDFRFVTLVSELPDPEPQLKQLITYNGDIFRIDTREKFAGGLQVRFECNDPNSGA
jgi:hypothetical protein